MTEDITQFRKERIKKIKQIYSDEASSARALNKTAGAGLQFSSSTAVKEALQKSFADRSSIVDVSRKLYASNPIYASLINYLSNMFMWRYKVTPHKVYTTSKAKTIKMPKEIDFQMVYNLMLEAVDGLSIETKFPAMLTLLFTQGAVYFTTVCDEDSIAIDTILLPDKYCRKVAETQFGTAIIEFDFSYFDSLGLTGDQLIDYIGGFPKEFKKLYAHYKADASQRWQQLDPRFSSGILTNDYSVPTYVYTLGGLIDYEKYQQNELERNENLLRHLVVQKMPVYQDKLVFEVDEVAALHKSMKKVIEAGDKTRLITTYGDVSVENIAEKDTVANAVLDTSFKAIFNNAGFNSAIFTADSVEALKMSLIRDKGIVWRYVLALLNFYTIAINNWFDFKDYEANIDILPISPYTYDDDIKVYKDNATLGVGKIDYIIASGIKQKNIADVLQLEKFLHLDEIVPMQTSYTQTAEDRVEIKTAESQEESSKSDIEPQTEEPIQE